MRKVVSNVRIISQDGTMDVPYEMVVIQRFEEEIYFLNRNLTGVEDFISDIRLAKYSTEAKAIKAMKMFRKAYTGSVAIFQNVEPTDKVVEALKRQDTEIVYASFDSQPSEIKFENHQNFYFQFPKDDEVKA